MRISKTSIGALALALAIAFSPFADLRAAPFANSAARLGSDTLTQTVTAETKARKHRSAKKGNKVARRHHGKHAMSKGPGKCGTYMYYSTKKNKCLDARAK
jgi:uncharacterized low-complexity protein